MRRKSNREVTEARCAEDRQELTGATQTQSIGRENGADTTEGTQKETRRTQRTPLS